MFPLSQCHPPFTPKTLEHPFPPLPHRTLCFQKPYPPKVSKNPKTLSRTAIQRITEKLQSLGYISHDPIESQKPEVDLGSPGEIFISRQLPARRVGHTIDDSWTSPDNPVPHPGAGPAIKQFHEIRRDLEKQKRKEKELTGRGKRVPPSVAELTIPEAELKRLRSMGIRLEKRVKVGKAGITEGIVNGIHERWRRSELVKIKCEDLCRMNMKRTHEILEMKTGGLVVWRSGSIIILYRGPNYKYPYFFSETKRQDGIDELSSELSNSDEDDSEDEESQTWTSSTSSSELISSNKLAPPSLVIGVGSPKKVRFQLPGEAQLEEEADRMLDGLGPRFSDWWGYNPLPIDADLLPAFIHGYRRPFRLLPYGVNPKLTGPEMTTLRRLGRPLPCHFALGRNKNLQGLAVAIIKLWEKCEIAKIAVKRGVQNTNSELMAEELKWLTGGTLLSRDREFIVFYRGKDFLPPAVSVAMEERRKNLTYAEKQRTDKNLSIVTIHEQLPVDSPSMDQQREACDEKKIHTKEQRKLRLTSLSVKSMAAKLSLVQERKVKAEKLLEKLEKAAEAKSPDVDKEGISEEERYMLRKVGLRMNAFLLLGRRGVFDGIVENMHLHWKYRELVKIISKDRLVEEVRRAAEILEVESGGILVAVERVNKGHAIIVYRGKNYERPTNLRPKTLLNKREAMKRSLEMQRRESLKLHVLKLTSDMDKLTLKLGNDAAMARSNGDIGTLDPYDMVEYAQGDGKVLNEQKTEASSLQPIGSDGVSSDCEVTSHTTLVKKKSHSQLQDSFPKYIDESAEAERVLLDEVESRSDLNSAAHPTHLLQQGGSRDDVPAIELRESPYKLVGGKPDSPLHRKVEEFDAEIPFRAAPLSNRERLLLRKQALKMKKRPVLAIGRNNVVTGVAKTIKTHFRRNPLAIVNVKGRANGTSIQELVFKLEQATGAVLVSQEPNKVILYRGWGEGDKPGCPKNGREATKSFTGGMPPTTLDSLSPELMAAIRFECGLQTRTEEHISGSE